MKEQLLYYVIKYKADWMKVRQAIAKEEHWEEIVCEDNYLTILDKEYPKQLLRLERPPWLLFYQGDISLLSQTLVSIVGAREASDYGIRATTWLVHQIKASAVIVSGLARGIDGVAHKEALDYSTIGVAACGLDMIYPKCNESLWEFMREKHLIVSEYPRGSKPLSHHFLIRNRIIAGLSNVLVVAEAKKKSGSQRTVSDALQIGNTVFAVPQPFDSVSGNVCNELIASGAQILASQSDVRLLLELAMEV